MNNQIIPICAITDEKLPFSAAVLFVSIMEHAKNDTFYKFYCFVTQSTSVEDRKRICAVADIYPNCSVEIIDMGEKYLDSINRHPTVTNACLYKFAIIEKLTMYDKVLYLDTDIIVNEDLTELYKIELKNNYVGGVFNIYYYLYKQNYKSMLNIPDLEAYFNAGVMLMNLKLMREDNILPLLESYIGQFQDSVDQHIFNKVCYGRIMNIHPKFNVTIKYKELYETEDSEIFYTKQEINEAINSPVIFHYTGIRKPWSYSSVPFAWKWYSCYLKSPFKDKKLNRISLKKNKKSLNQVTNKFWNLKKIFFDKIYAKLGIKNDYYQYFSIFSFLTQKKDSPLLFFIENLKSSDENKNLLKIIKELKNKKRTVVIVALNQGDLRNEFSEAATFLLNIKNIDNRILKTLRFYKFVFLSEINLYKLATAMCKYQTSYIWLINNKEQKDKIISKDKMAKEVLNNSKNIIENVTSDKISEITGKE